MVGSMTGYLTTLLEPSYRWQARRKEGNDNCILNYSGQINEDEWEAMLIDELKKTSGSTMVHEFQHWFQESVYYPSTRQMKPTKRLKGGGFPKPPPPKPNLKPPKAIQ